MTSQTRKPRGQKARKPLCRPDHRAARQWWQGLGNSQRTMWQQRVDPLKGREMIAAAWKQSQGI